MVKKTKTAKEFSNPILEFEKLILINHKVGGDVKSVLTDVYNKGIEMGKLQGMFLSEFNNLPQVKEFKFELFLQEAVKNINPERISNIRKMQYTGPDITHYSILSSDFTTKQVIKMLASFESDYMYFEREHFEKSYYEEQLKEEYDDEDRKYTTNKYNTLEVRIFVIKCYQVGYSEGTKLANRLPYGIRYIFETGKDVANYRAGIKSSIKDDSLADSLCETVERYKEKHPDWKEYEKYFV